MRFRLYHYWRSSSSWRVRWGMALKGVVPEYVHVDLLNGESESPAHRARNPFGFVPALEILAPPAGRASPLLLTESLAILEYLEETLPTNPLLPHDPIDRAYVRAIAEAVNAGIQPLQNLTTQIALAPDSDADFARKRKAWAQLWIREGFAAIEKLAKPSTGKFCVGDELTLADLCLVPQCYNALRNDVALEDFPVIARIYAQAILTPSYAISEPDRFKPA